MTTYNNNTFDAGEDGDSDNIITLGSNDVLTNTTTIADGYTLVLTAAQAAGKAIVGTGSHTGIAKITGVFSGTEDFGSIRSQMDLSGAISSNDDRKLTIDGSIMYFKDAISNSTKRNIIIAPKYTGSVIIPGPLKVAGNSDVSGRCNFTAGKLLPEDVGVSSNAVVCDLNTHNHFHVDADAAISSVNLQNPVAGQTGHIVIQNASALTHSITWNVDGGNTTYVKWQGAAVPTFSSTSGSIDIVSYYVLSTTEILLSASINHSSSTGTLTSYTLSNVDINSGAIDGTIIGANSASSATFSGVTLSGHALPSADNTYDVGSGSYRVRKLYINEIAATSLSGTPTAPTASSSTNTTQIATTAFVQSAITSLIDSAPDGLNTLNELAAALNDDTSYASTVTTSLGTKAPLASPALTGTPTAPTASANTNSTQIATTAYVDNNFHLSTSDWGDLTSGLVYKKTNLGIGGTNDTVSDCDGILFCQHIRFRDSSNVDCCRLQLLSVGEMRYYASSSTHTSGSSNWGKHSFYSKGIKVASIIPDSGNTNLNFTGQHRNYEDNSTFDLNSYIGYIVQSTGIIDSIAINEALPRVKLTDTINCKSVYGVISSREEKTTESARNFGNFVSVNQKEEKDSRLVINSVGEGGIWVCDAAGPIENGDYITTCLIPGIGMKQSDDLLHNYTVAKATMDCDFNPQLVPKKTVTGFDNVGRPIYEYDTNTLVPEYTIKHTAHNELIASQGLSNYKFAFIGCTYHCG